MTSLQWECQSEPGRGRQSDAELVASCLAGRHRAWDRLVARYSELVFSVPRRMGLDETAAEDVHQRVFLLLFRKLHTLRETHRLAGWLLTTTQRESWRVARDDRAVASPEGAMAVDVNGSDQVERWERQQLVREALQRLGGREARLLAALFSAPGTTSYEVLAGTLGMAVGSIGPTRARAFAKLESILIDLGYAPNGDSSMTPACVAV